jgi:hypothetical protein
VFGGADVKVVLIRDGGGHNGVAVTVIESSFEGFTEPPQASPMLLLSSCALFSSAILQTVTFFLF